MEGKRENRFKQTTQNCELHIQGKIDKNKIRKLYFDSVHNKTVQHKL
jgi:hypothetical protein